MNTTGGIDRPLTASQVLARLNANATIALTAPLTTTQQITSTVATGTAPFVVASTTAVANLNASLLLGNTWAIPGSIGATTPNAGAFTTLSSTVGDATIGLRVAGATGRMRVRGYVDATNGMVVEATTTNEAAYVPMSFGASVYRFFSGAVVSVLDTTASTSTSTGALVVSGGVGVAGDTFIGGKANVTGHVLVGTATDFATVSVVDTAFTGTTFNSNLIASFRSNASGRAASFQLSDNVANSYTLSMIAGALRIGSNSIEQFQFSAAGSFVIGTAALATNATDGFLYLPTCAGAPSGTPTAFTGAKAAIYDTTNNKLWVYNGAWKGVVLA